MRTRLMTTLVLVAGLLLLVGQALAQPQLPTFQSGDVLRADQLNRIVEQVRRNANAAGSSGGGATHTVDCNAGETIQNKIGEAQPGDTIMITGTCNEAVVVNKDDITLDGGGSAVIDGAGVDLWAVDVTGRQKVTIQGLTVQNGHEAGIMITESSAVWMQDVTVRNSRRHKDYDGGGFGIFIGHSSSVVLTGAIVADDNADHGIMVWQSSSALAAGNFTPRGSPYPQASVQTNGNGGNGIFVAASSSFTAFSNFGANTTVQTRRNTSSGISVQQSSSVIVSSGADLEATNNQGDGLEVGGASSAQFWGWAAESRTASGLFDSNRGAGISVWGSSSFAVWDDGVAVNITSTKNRWRGLHVVDGSLAAFNSPEAQPPSKLVVSDNGAEGMEAASNGSLFSKFPAEIKNNANEGVGVWGSSYVDLTNAVIADNKAYGGIVVVTNSAANITACRIENNTGNGIEASNNSTVHIYDTTITGNTGHGITGYNHAFVQAFQDTGSSITGNGNHGVNAWNGVSIELYNATITGNMNDDVNASFGSRIRFPGGTIGDIVCDDSVLSQGDWLCPASN